jgi:hypothetical protein
MRLPTASKLDLFRSCAGPWYLPLPARQETGSKAAERGRSLHKFAETGATQSVRGKKTLAEESVERALEDLPAWEALPDVPSRECVVRYRPSDGDVRVIGASTRSRPYGDDDHEYIWGTADIVGLAGGSLLLADLKTGSADWLKLPIGGLDEAPLQTLFLAAVFNRVLHFSRALVGIVSSATERAYLRPMDAHELDEVLQYISGLVASPPARLNPGEHCTFCPVRPNCPLFTPGSNPGRSADAVEQPLDGP